MIKKILIGLVILLVLLGMWLAIKTVMEASRDGLKGIFTTTFFSIIPTDVTNRLSVTPNKSPAEVSIEDLGEFSPAVGLVTITTKAIDLASSDVSNEYIEILASPNNVQPVNISNWSIQSMISDEWIGIPQGTEKFVAGEVNELQDIYLRPGERAIISTAGSPVGVSFRVNRCAGFLSDTQSFTPKISTACIPPQNVLPPTIENIKEFGDVCISFVENFNSCSYLTTQNRNFDTLSQTCRDYIQPRLTYNYCSDTYSNDTNFYSPQEWRIFLNQDHTLWRKNYEIIRLLDDKHRTIDVINF